MALNVIGLNWDNVHKHTYPDKDYHEFLKTFLFHCEAFFPKDRILINNKNLASPWKTKGILKPSRRKQKLYEMFLKRKTTRDEENYKNYKKLFESVKKKAN